MSTDQPKARTEDTSVAVTDILFDCPACAKSLVVDEAAEGMIVDCPQCRSNVIVPPQSARPEPPPAATKEPPAVVREKEAPRPIEKPIEEKLPAPADAPSQNRLTLLTGQLREIQTQRTEVTGRIATRLNDVNRDLVLLARLETSQQKLLAEWNQLVEKISPDLDIEEFDLAQPSVLGASISNREPTRIPFRRG
jgi:DNA-directed RNA polymerase subunit RPC12/RpoP